MTPESLKGKRVAMYGATSKIASITTAISHYVMVPALVALNKAARALGKYFPYTAGTAKMLAKMPDFETETMQRELGLAPQSFAKVIKDLEATLKK